MNQNIVFLFPGQASQYVGMGKDLYDHSSNARDVMDRIAAMDGLGSIPDLCFNGPIELLTRTDNVQPAITTVSLMALAAVNEAIGQDGNIEFRGRLKACAGHSLGEYAAHVAAENLTESTAVKLVSWRGRWMNEAAQPPNPPGAMVAVMGLEVDMLRDIVNVIGAEIIALANINSLGQIILSGTEEAISKAEQIAQEKGAKKTVMLNVSGAWHSPLMVSAESKMKQLIANELTPENVSLDGAPFVVANVSAREVTNFEDVKHTLIRQITSPVNWVESVQRLSEIGEGTSFEDDTVMTPLFVEVGPGKVLRGLMRGIDRKLEVINVGDMAGVEKLMEKLRK